MEATAPGRNRTGAATDPKGIEQMLKAVDELSPVMRIDTMQIDAERQLFIAEAEAVGSIPPRSESSDGKSRKKGFAAPASPALDLLLDKLGERLAFERTGTRLYTALISKHLALINSADDPLPAAIEGEPPATTLQRIRAEELGHFHLLCDCVVQLDGDPTAQTPCADVIAAASSGLMQVVTDPRTTLAQSLSAILTAELTDNAGWELLIKLAQNAGQNELAEPFIRALEAEEQHLLVIRGWIESLLATEAGTPAV